jgi:energy-coupling factor transport system permease protein
MPRPDHPTAPPGTPPTPSSRLQQVHPLCKLGVLVSFTVLTFAVRQPWHALVLFAVILGGYGLAGITLRGLLRRLRTILLFGLMIIIIQLIFHRGGQVLFTWEVGARQFSVYSEGVAAGVMMAFRFINVITASHLFVLTTDPNRLAHALMTVGLPYVHGFMLITALRFVPVFRYELGQIRVAQQAKGIRLDRSLKGLYRGVRYLLLPVVVSALSKVDALTVSMEGRAFGLYPKRTFRSTQALHRWEVGLLLSAVAVTVLYILAPALAG